MNRRNFLASLCGLAVSFVLPRKAKAEPLPIVPAEDYTDRWDNAPVGKPGGPMKFVFLPGGGIHVYYLEPGSVAP